MNTPDNIWQGWSTLTHGGLLMDEKRLAKLAEYGPRPLSGYLEEDLRRKYLTFQEGQIKPGEWVQWILEKVCGFGPESGYWERAGEVSSSWTRTAITGEAVKPRHLWHSSITGVLPIFISDGSEPIGRGRGRKTVSNVLHWLRSSDCRLALLTNGRQWRLLYAALDADAWCEWDADRFLEEGGVGLQLEMLRTLIAPSLWSSPSRDQASPLLSLVLESRKGQSELSSLLGERVREAVELLIRAHGDVLATECSDVAPAEIYRAAVRVMMRLVVVLFAESRDLLPRSNDLYHRSYGVNGLLEELEKRGGRGGERLAHTYAAWPRLQSLFRLVHQGSPHPALPVPAYGGELFEPGASNDPDGTRRTLHVLEYACFRAHVISDREVLHLLQRISRTSQRIRQGRTNQLVTMPVDFSDLGSEYIGILYEGLLDFELRRAAHEDPMVFLAVGNEPVLPLSRLEDMEDAQIRNLLQKLKASKDKSEESSDDEEGSEEEETVDNEDATDDDEASSDDLGEDDPETALLEEPEEPGDVRQSARNRVQQWAERVVIVTGLVKAPKGRKSPESERYKYESEVRSKAKSLIRKIILPGEWFLVRWGGTRKGSGTFYTRPGLSVPTVHRTLRPLAYTAPMADDGTPDTLAPAANWAPKRPEEILALKVCDPACGSGSFPVAALRFLTEALYRSLLVHGRIRSVEEGRSFIALFDQQGQVQEHLGSEMIPCPQEDDRFEPRLKARLRRHVVERCIYGVDLDPLAVELCRLALWVETMDRELPFSFLDHKVKCGNGLVGAWFDTFQHYPVMAWKNKQTGDEKHNNCVHFNLGERKEKVDEWKNNSMTPTIRQLIEGTTLFSTNLLNVTTETHTHTLRLLRELNAIPVHETGRKADIYKREILASEGYRTVRKGMDLWCACWFWPSDKIEYAPTALDFLSPSDEVQNLTDEISRENRFFHWELEFPEVFHQDNHGFDAILGNPPWETLQPNSKEFFSNIDPLYRSYGKQVALKVQKQLFSDQSVERSWLDYNEKFASFTNWMKYVGNPFGDPSIDEDNASRFPFKKSDRIHDFHETWRNNRKRTKGFSSSSHPFRHRGEGKAYTYKLFIEQGYALLKENGRLGFIVPSGIYSDNGTTDMRKLLLHQCRWEWLFGFENRHKVFDIDSRFKFNPIIFEKGGKTNFIHAAFMRKDLIDWEQAEKYSEKYSVEQVQKFSPKSLSLLEIQNRKDLEILEKIYANSIPLGDQGPEGWGVKYRQGDFNMTSDSKLFPPRPQWEAQGYKPDEYSRWLKGNWRPIAELWDTLGVTVPEGFTSRVAQPPYDKIPIPRKDIPAGIIISRFADEWIREEEIEDISVPLYQGIMINNLNSNASSYTLTEKNNWKWVKNEISNNTLSPKYLINIKEENSNPKWKKGIKIAFRGIARNTDQRTFIGSILDFYSAGHSISFLKPNSNSVQNIFNLSILTSSYFFDYQIRMRMAGTNLSEFILSECFLPINYRYKSYQSIVLSIIDDGKYSRIGIEYSLKDRYQKRAFTLNSKISFQVIAQVTAAYLFKLDTGDIRHILQETDYPVDYIQKNKNELWSTGFWRVEKEKDPELRQTVLTIIAFHDLQKHIEACGGDREKGLDSFLNQNNGEGWMIPETLRLADYGLGHDDRALEHQPVASRLGPRYYDWQLAQTPEESWAECHVHARNLLGREAYDRLIHRIENGLPPGG